MSFNHPFRALPLLLAGAAWFAACSSPADGPAAAPCQKDADCGDGVCNLESRECVPAAVRQAWIEVVPPAGNNQGWVLQEFPKPRPRSDGQLVLELRKEQSVQGRVVASHDPELAIPAQITAWRESLLPGRPKVQVETSTEEEKSGGFVLWLEGGYEYTLYIRPKPPFDASYPPRTFKLEVVDHVKQDFALDGDDRAIEVQGRILNAVGMPLPFSVQVRAFKSDTWIRSTVGVTCSQAAPEHCPDGKYTEAAGGTFSIRVPPGVEAYSMRVEPLPVATSDLIGTERIPLIPTMECTNKVLGLVETNKDRSLQKISTPIKLPSFEYARMFTVSIVGGQEAQQQQPLSGVQVKFATELTARAGLGFDACTASYQRTEITDGEGKATLPLLPGDAKNREYDVTVLSPASGKHASQWRVTSVGASGGVLQTIVLDPRYAISGSIVDPRGAGVSGATIEAQGVMTSATQAEGLPPGKATATADERGRFVLHVDPGVYNLHVRPPADRGLPQFGVEKRAVEGPVSGLVLAAPAARVLPGRVVDALGNPAPGFAVSAYEPVAESPETESAVLRAAATTGADGTFRLLLAE